MLLKEWTRRSISSSSKEFKDWSDANPDFNKDCYLTPNTPDQPIVDLVHKVLGDDFVDAFTTDDNWLQAGSILTPQQSAFDIEWIERSRKFFLNPPFSQGVRALNRAQVQSDRWEMEGIALTLSGQLHNKTCSIDPSLVLHWRGRVGFVVLMDGEPVQITGMNYDVILSYWSGTEGDRGVATFADVFGGYGRIHQPYF